MNFQNNFTESGVFERFAYFVMKFCRSGRISSNWTSHNTTDALNDSSTNLWPFNDKKCIPNEASPCFGADNKKKTVEFDEYIPKVRNELRTSPVYKFKMMLSIWKANCRNVATSFFGGVDFLPSEVWTSTSTAFILDNLLTVLDVGDFVSYNLKINNG